MLVAAVGAIATFSTHRGATQELEARADASVGAFTLWRLERQAELQRDATAVAEQMEAGGAARGAIGRVSLPARLMRHDLVRGVDGRDDVTWVAEGAGWVGLPGAAALVERAQRGLVAGGLAVDRYGTVVLMGVVPVRLPEGRFGAVLVGNVIGPAQMAQIAAPLDLKLVLGPAAEQPSSAPDPAGERRFTHSVPVLAGSPRARLVATVSTERVSAVTRQALVTAVGTGAAIAGLLLVLLWILLRVTVLGPLGALRDAIRAMGRGDQGVRLRAGGPRELREVTEGFTRMAETVDEQHRRLEGLAASDPLTGVANHRSFHERLEAAIEEARRANGSVGLVALDLDRFKQINDDHGHPCGDDLLRAAAAGLREVVRADDFLARVGGEEFALLLPGASHALAWEVAERARATVAQVRAEGIALTSSAGIACFPSDATDAATLLERADRALYTAKREGRDQTRRYHARQGARNFSDRERAEIVDVLRRPDALMPVFQPLVDLASGRLVGYEALARFAVLPARPPDAWFSQARRCGLGHELEAAALRAALEVPDRPPSTFLSLNLSPSALAAEPVRRVLPQDLSQLVIEVTEHEAVSDDEGFRRLQADLRSRGARIALDDAGAGYAGLQAVMRLDLDVLKLDRSLIDGVHGDFAKVALVESFVRFARRTGAAVCAEGIESLDDLNVLADLDVSLGQGYVLARPGPAWSAVSPSVAEVLLRRSVASAGDLSAREGLPETGDRRLEALSGRMSRVASTAELPALFRVIGDELRADDVCFSEWDSDRREVTEIGATGECDARPFALTSFPATERVLQAQESAQVVAGDPSADRAEVGLLLTGPYRSLLMVPVISLGRTVGLLELFREREEPWQRSDVNRARIIAYQLGPVLEALARDATPAPANVTSLSEHRGRRG